MSFSFVKELADSMTAYWRAGGWLMLPLAVVAFLILYRSLVVMRTLREAVATPEEYYEKLGEHVRQYGGRRALDAWLLSLPGAVPRLAWHVLVRTDAGLPMRTAFRQCREAELTRHTHAFTMLAALVVAAPLLGLLGTVFGMVETFQAVAARHADTAPMVADGISQALVTTQIGLVAALPGTFALAHLHRLRRRLANDIDRCESHLVACRAAGPLPDGRGGAS